MEKEDEVKRSGVGIPVNGVLEVVGEDVAVGLLEGDGISEKLSPTKPPPKRRTNSAIQGEDNITFA